MKIALVHDYLKEFGGAERVLLSLHEIWPEAPIYTIFYKKNSPAGKAFEGARIIQSWFGRLPFCEKLISPCRFLIPLIWKEFDLSSYDLVISSASWAITKGFKKKGSKMVEICYCHTPPRYLYGYETSKNWKKYWWLRVYAGVVNHFLRMYDFRQAQKVDVFVANSQEVQRRIKKFYRRESVVINPPVDLPKLKVQSEKLKVKEYYLAGGRLERAKNFDLIIQACEDLGKRLKIYGGGSQEDYLKSLAGAKTEFLGRVSDEEKERLIAGCAAFIVAATDEDFGITPVEAMAGGKAVIAFKGGGYLETVIEGKTGIFFEEPTKESLKRAIEKFEEWQRQGGFRAEECRRQAEKFSKKKFQEKIKELVEKYA